jgi:hypothetical protein
MVVDVRVRVTGYSVLRTVVVVGDVGTGTIVLVCTGGGVLGASTTVVDLQEALMARAGRRMRSFFMVV